MLVESTMSCSSDDQGGHRAELGEALGHLAGDRALDLRALGLVTLVDEHHRVVLERDAKAARPPDLLLLPDHDGLLELAPHVGRPLLDRDGREVAEAELRLAAADAMVPIDRDDLDHPGAGVVDAGEARARGKRPWRGRLLCFHSFVTSTTTKLVAFESGLHSATLTVSPIFADRQGGLWAWSLLERFS